ncbi:MAG TPA: phosphate acyltransferase PlsX [Acidimicrobiia bacterium]|nr:phosphate acyltransferase PlsX [Acidimicrobiia bacterium]
MIPIALDAMGGDKAPVETVAGAVQASAEGVEVVLVGDRTLLKPQLQELGADLEIVHAAQTIGMGDDPAAALRDKPDSSISVAARLVKEGRAGAMVSAGSTGAAMAAAAILIGRAKGVIRPTIASVIPTPGTSTLVLDSGANPEVKPEHLVQFALMGTVAAEVFFGMTNPRVGLLNIGEEKGKGRSLEKEAYELLAQTSINFIGNVEGRDLATGRADVWVTDGFVGNVLLKVTEGVAAMVLDLATESLAGKTKRSTVVDALAPLRRRLDYEHTGGAHLLGVNGVVVISHGSSGRTAIANALRMAHDGMERDLVGRMTSRLAGS